MPEFFAETYTPREGRGAAAPRAGDLARAAAQASQPGAPVRFLGAIIVPGEETCFGLYRATDADAVRAAMTAAGLRPEQITQAVTLRPPYACPGPAPRTPPGHPRRNLARRAHHRARTALPHHRRAPGRPDAPASPPPPTRARRHPRQAGHDRARALLVTRHQPPIHPPREHDHASNHPRTAVPPGQRAGLAR